MSNLLKKSKISGVGSFVPPRIVRNEELTQMLDTSDEWIRTRTGIEQRHWVEKGPTVTSDLALQASLRALAAAKIDKSQIDCIILATLSADHEFPGTACFLQAKLGLSGCAAIDVRQQCTGFVYSLSIADQFIRTGMYKNVLVVGAELQSKGLDRTPEGRDISVLFGDGAGAVVVSVCDQEPGPNDSQIFSTHLHADGAFAKELWIEAPSISYDDCRMNEKVLAEKRHFPRMNGKTVFVNASKRMPEAILEAMKKNEFTLDQVDLFLFHQANLRINEMVAKQLGIPEHKIFNTIQKFGNTTAATIPLGMDEAIKAGVLKKGMLVASAAFGSGFTWASALFRY